jgi:hypothetical protein
MKPSKPDPSKQKAGDRSQQQSAFEPKKGPSQKQMGEGSYQGTRDYNQRTADYLKSHDVEADAEAAKPRSAEEAREMKEAEEKGKSRSKGE